MDGRGFTYKVEGSDTVNSLMEKIQDKNGIPINQQALVYNGKRLQESRSLVSYDIQKESTLHFKLDLDLDLPTRLPQSNILRGDTVFPAEEAAYLKVEKTSG